MCEALFDSTDISIVSNKANIHLILLLHITTNDNTQEILDFLLQSFNDTFYYTAKTN